jgi:hypothetical protein
MGIFLAAMLAITGLYFQNLRLARMAQEEIILSMIQRDVMSRNLVVANTRCGDERAWVRANAGSVPSGFSPQFSLTGFGTAADTDPATVMTLGWGVRNIESWEAVSGLHWGRSAPAAMHDVPLYTGFYFAVAPVERHFPSGTGAVSDWGAVGNTPGLALEDCQFTDFDGYGLVDMDDDGEPETDRGLPSPSPGPIMNADLSTGGADYANSPFRLFYNSRSMSRYMLKLRVRVMWNVRNLADLTLTDREVLDFEGGTNVTGKNPDLKRERVFHYTTYYFSAFNPDVVKRWQP